MSKKKKLGFSNVLAAGIMNISKSIQNAAKEFNENMEVVDHIEKTEAARKKVDALAVDRFETVNEYESYAYDPVENPIYDLVGYINRIQRSVDIKTEKLQYEIDVCDTYGEKYPTFLSMSLREDIADKIREAATIECKTIIRFVFIAHTDKGDRIFVKGIKPIKETEEDKALRRQRIEREKRRKERREKHEFDDDFDEFDYSFDDDDQFDDDHTENIEQNNDETVEQSEGPVQATKGFVPAPPVTSAAPEMFPHLESEKPAPVLTSEQKQMQTYNIGHVHTLSPNYQPVNPPSEVANNINESAQQQPITSPIPMEEPKSIDQNLKDMIENMRILLNVCLKQNYFMAKAGFPVHLQSELKGITSGVYAFGDVDDEYSLTIGITIEAEHGTYRNIKVETRTSKSEWFNTLKEYANNKRAVSLTGTFMLLDYDTGLAFYLEKEPILM